MDILASGLAQGQSIQDVVKEQVHDTHVGKEATAEWIDLLLLELQCQLDAPINSRQWNEDAFGTLLSAAGLTARYVTEATVFAPHVGDFESIFLRVLQIPVWTTPLLGLKMVSLRGCTRLLECFGAAVQRNADVVAWISTALDTMLAQDENQSHAIQLLFRPICEHGNVLVQTHPSTSDSLLPLVSRFFELYTSVMDVNEDQHKDDIVEFALFLSVLLDAKLPPLVPARALMTTPSNEVPPVLINLMTESQWHQFCSSSALAVMTPVFPSLYAVAALELPPPASAACFQAFSDQIMSSLSTALVEHSVEALEQTFTWVESLRDILLRYVVPSKQQECLLTAQLTQVIPTIQALLTNLADVAKNRSLRGVKTSIADIREAAIECYVAVMHCMGASFWDVQVEFKFLHAVAVKVADPMLFGDFLFVLRPTSPHDDNRERYANMVTSVASILTKGLSQAHRYSKALAVRMVDGVGRVALATGTDLAPHIPDLAETLLDIQDISPSVRSASVVALTRLFCIAPFEDDAVQDAYFEMLSTGVLASKECALEAMTVLLQHESAALIFTATQSSAFWLDFLETCMAAFSSVPIFEEDVALLMHQLHTCDYLLDHHKNIPESLRTAFKPTVDQLHDTACADGLDHIEAASAKLLSKMT
ncbi:Aste57867_17408 [Aphanomyces stellatus]|uniref:Aste57867_17408 protein n=1 Tax=Aphanomyces stellatus TaxID=120398 RepID=A0A485L8G2_9STRA|nr:hypothetical protein As57867_017348 [Aphanomyces stellatus]VFT94164.1 Aste57867_17408 [Aphanomyces stellatus]